MPTISNICITILILYYILPSLGTKTPETLGRRLLYSLHHHHQVTPLHRVTLRVFVILGQLESTRLQTLHVHHHTTVLGMKQLHQPAAGTDEDENVAIAHIAPHTLMHYTAQRTDALAHIRTPRTQVIPHRVIQAEHGS